MSRVSGLLGGWFSRGGAWGRLLGGAVGGFARGAVAGWLRFSGDRNSGCGRCFLVRFSASFAARGGLSDGLGLFLGPRTPPVALIKIIKIVK